ncbi:MAG: hypothetical protein GY851_22185 [bacterium]|nr:hypothetical protein [bacterium]
MGDDHPDNGVNGPEDAVTSDEAETPTGTSAVAPGDALSEADAALEERLAEPVFKGDQGIDTAQIWIAAFLVVAVGAIAYSNGFSIPFHYEDQVVIRDNMALHAPLTFAESLSAPRSGGPVAMLSFAMNWWVAGGSPKVFHAVNILLHLLNGVLLFLVSRRLLGKGVREPVAMAAAMLFVLHPANTESVNYIVGRAGVLALTFGLSSLLLFLRAVRDDQGIRGWALGASLVLFVVARGCEWTALALPLIVLLVDWTMHGERPLMKRAWVHGLYWAILGALVAVRAAVQPEAMSGTGAGLLARAAGLMDYFILSVSPGGLCVTHPAPWGGPGWLGLAIVCGLAVATALLATRRLSVAAALGWYLAALAPAWIALSNWGIVSERYLYLPLAGASMLLPALFAVALKEGRVRAIGGVVLAAIVLVAGVGTFMRNRTWHDEATLWTDAVAKEPDSAIPQLRLASLSRAMADDAFARSLDAARAGEGAAAARDRELAQLSYGETEQFLRAALERSPDDGEALASLGLVLERLGKGEAAVEVLEQALQLDTSNVACTVRLAGMLHAQALTTDDPGSQLGALEYYARVDRLGGLTTDLRVQYAGLLLSVGNLPAAEQVLSRAGDLPDDSAAARQLTEIRRALGEIRQAEAQAQSLMRTDPAGLGGVLMSARTLVGLGKDVDAAYLLHSVLRDHPGEGAAWSMLGLVKARMGQSDGFIEEYGPTQPFSMEGGNAWEALARTCAASGLWDGAKTYLESRPAQASGITLPLMRLGGYAEEFGQAQRAGQLYEQAANAYPEEAAPVIRLCEFAIEAKNAQLAHRLLEEAGNRSADPALLTRLTRKVAALGDGSQSVDDTAVMQ